MLATCKSDRTIIFSSHLLADIERMADHIAVLDYSVLRAQCSLETFRSCVQQFVLDFAGDVPELPKIRGLIQCVPRGRQMRLTLVNLTQETRQVLQTLAQHGSRKCRLRWKMPLSATWAAAWNASALRGDRTPGGSGRCVMIYVFLRELRENLKWGMMIFAVRWPSSSMTLRDAETMLMFRLLEFVWLAPLAGLLMGAVQTIFETKPDNWGFAVHRPVPRSASVHRQVCGGFAAAVRGPDRSLPGRGGVGGGPGNLPIPFQSRMVCPTLADALNAGCYYFAGIVLTLRRARWLGRGCSRWDWPC